LYILWPFGIFCGDLVYFVMIWYIFPVLVCCSKKNLASLVSSTHREAASSSLEMVSIKKIKVLAWRLKPPFN
jgi:hypothetical protein